jgi:NitT/TauT family transport system substrate-binding protein
MVLIRSRVSLIFYVLPVLLPVCISSCRRAPADTEKEKTNQVSQERSANPLRKIRVYPYWVTTSQFAGYYVGKEKGIFRKYGIDLQILEFKPYLKTEEIISRRQADFAVLWLVNAIQLKSSGVDIINIAQFSTHSSLMLLAKKSSGIKKLEDLQGKRAGIWEGYDLQPRALFSRYKLDTKIIPIGSTNNLFLNDGVDVTNANLFDEYHTIINSGYNEDELIRFYFFDYGLNFLEDGIYCLDSLARTDPPICEAFVSAAIESWLYTFSHQEESLGIILRNQRFQKVPANYSHQKWMISKYRELYLREGRTTLNIILNEQDYRANAQVLLENNMIKSIPPYREFFKPYNGLLQTGNQK